MIFSKKSHYNQWQRLIIAVHCKHYKVNRRRFHVVKSETINSIRLWVNIQKWTVNTKTYQQNNTKKSNIYLRVIFQKIWNERNDLWSTKSTNAHDEFNIRFKYHKWSKYSTWNKERRKKWWWCERKRLINRFEKKIWRLIIDAELFVAFRVFTFRRCDSFRSDLVFFLKKKTIFNCDSYFFVIRFFNIDDWINYLFEEKILDNVY